MVLSHSRHWLLTIGIGCLLFVAGALEVGAQSGTAGIGIKPATIEDMMEPSSTKQFSTTISNLSGQEQTYYLYTRDIVSATDAGVPVFAQEGIEETEFELRQWITLDTESFTLMPGEDKNLGITISVPAQASPGTHFGGIFVSVEPPELRESGAAVGYEVANIISIRVAGDVKEDASIRQFSTDNYIYGFPEVAFTVKIENNGNTLLRPTGPLIIKNMFGKKVGELVFNDKLGGVFPGNEREFLTTWTGEPPGFGRYEARVSPVYGEAGSHQTLSSTVTFWILPLNIILPALGILAALLLVSYGLARLYVRRALAEYSTSMGSRRVVRRKRGSNSAFLFVIGVMMVVTILFLIALVVLFA